MKYLFTNDRVSTIVSIASDFARDTWPRKMATLLERPAYQLNEDQSKEVKVMRQRILELWYSIFETLPTLPEEKTLFKVFWPNSEDQDFLVQYLTQGEYRAQRYNEIEGRTGYGYVYRRDATYGVELQTRDVVYAAMKEKLVAIIGDKPLDIETSPASFPENSTLITASYKAPEGAIRRPWMDAAKWPLAIIQPEVASEEYITKSRGGKVKSVTLTAEEGLYPMSTALRSSGFQYAEADLGLVLHNLEERVLNARNAYYAEVRARMRSNVTETTQVKVRTAAEVRKSAEAFSKHRKTKREQLAATLKGKEAIGMLPFIGHGYAASRRWGIEIESGGARGIEAPKGWKRKGDGSLRSAWAGWVNDGSLGDIMIPGDEVFINPENCPSGVDHRYEIYDVDRMRYIRNPTRPGVGNNPDCNLCDRYVTTDAGPAPIGHVFREQTDDRAEFVSPILRSMHSNGLEELLDQVIQQPQNDSAGVHVHVEATDLTARQLGSLVYGYDMIEGLIESSYRRTKRQYCKLRDDGTTMEILRQAKTAKSLLNVPSGDRYVTLNLQSLQNHGTVEFRAMGNVYDYEYLSRWAMFCREMVNVARAGVTAKEWNDVSSWADVTALFAKYGKEYIRAVMDTMGETVPSSPRLTKDATISMPSGNEETSEIAVSGSTFADLVATMDEGAVNSRWITTVEQSIAGINSESSQRILVGALASGETEV